MLFGRFRDFLRERQECLIQTIEAATCPTVSIKGRVESEFKLILDELDAMERDVLSTIPRTRCQLERLA